MDLHVRFEVGTLVEAAIAHGTLVGRLLQVRHLVHGESSRLTETFATVIALEWLLFGVDVAMVAEMILATESLAANVAAVRPLIGVRTLVDQQIVALGELTIAVLADELLLWTRSSRTGDFKRAHAIACYRWKSLIVGVASVMHVLLINRSASNPMAHQSSVMLSRCRSGWLMHLSVSERIRCR